MLFFSVMQPFNGDYVGLRRNPSWKDVLSKNSLHKMDRYIVFADIVNKINRSNGKVGKACKVFVFFYFCVWTDEIFFT